MPDCTIRLAKAGDAAAFEDLVKRHERLVIGTAMRLVNGTGEDAREAARDAAQQVFLKLYRHLGSFREEQSFTQWLYRITVNVCRDINRRARVRRSFPLEERASAERASPEPGALAVLELDERRRLVAEALNSLPEKERAAIVLRDIQGLETREVAAILECSEATIRSQICAGRKKLKEIVERRMR